MSCTTTSTTTIGGAIIHQVEDEDDEFDWDAAVKEIDVACQRASSSASVFNSTFSRLSNQENKNVVSRLKPSGSSSGVCRQSTLDRFVQINPSVNNHWSSSNNNCNSNSNRRVVKKDFHVRNNNQNGDAVGGDGNYMENEKAVATYCEIDFEAAKTWIYPVNIPLRDYQFSITKTALFANTMVALPTGLGKTLIAAVVMYNYYRWFPEGKIIFTAPSRPLVMQQIEACHNIVGIPQEWTIDLTGQTSPDKRACLWKDKRVFFVTPQVLEKDIQSGTCLIKHIVCLVIDEAHRALGNYSYCVAIRELMDADLQFRILALTATPGSQQQAIQKIIDNLHISKLEYRSESDHDVITYVHSRKLELIKVPMGKDASEITDLLLEAGRHYLAKLASFGVVLNRDIQTLSPIDFLNTRDKLRQAPPADLFHTNIKDADGYLGVLISLSHIRKLLSSHGIKPAYEMLEAKLHDGYMKLTNRNEMIWKAKHLMEQNLSHGAPNPKLLKMIEILIDHFKTNDPKNSRVIIFSNFRGSVRDIMNSLSSIGESVKAAEFIGQSSGKTLKGQTQKIQQAVLQKFRAGGYNIIVATSIGEEGLDIMEVDLVICFDANVSSLRMIQRMGRTGRKNDGRVVVLACEGAEIKAYLRKQANSKVVKRHMHNGGMNSFDFHLSPRMIPHICKPEVQYVEFSIEKFVPRGKKVKDDSVDDHTFKARLSDAEAELIAKYFCSSGKCTWKPSLIAFPHFQAFPSRVHNVMHSFRTRMLIGGMQHVQAQSFFMDNKPLPDEIQVLPKTSSSQCLGAETHTHDARSEKDAIIFPNARRKFSDFEAFDTVISTEKHYISDSPRHDVPTHSFLFGAAYVSVKSCGTVSIASVPSLSFVHDAPLSKSTEYTTELLNNVKHSFSPSRASSGYDRIMRSEANLRSPAKAKAIYNCHMSTSVMCNSEAHEEPLLHEVENNAPTPSPPKRSCTNFEVIVVETPASTRRNIPIGFANESTSNTKDMEMSPRLTNMVEEGVVPESPLGEIGDHLSNEHTRSEHVNCGSVPICSREVHGNECQDSKLQSADLPNCESRRKLLFPGHTSVAFCSTLPMKELNLEKTDNVKQCSTAGAIGHVTDSPINVDRHSPSVQIHSCLSARGNTSGSPINVETRTPLSNLTNSCSSDWRMSSGEASKNTQKPPKFKRLRKYGESTKRISSNIMEDDSSGPISNLIRSTTRRNPVKHIKGYLLMQKYLMMKKKTRTTTQMMIVL
ncbi:hypothetical protein AQUCO_01400156v1 [Aquilegia coerulea]|uniref:Helicase ATP-binding domain-containing protein n=1 Tax=Aquilegia coerulea TaxID=218851 RepID=A0A2G5DV22_AQUCA|nr:hypothetical protein AQUCO_01400156v1 [Aquilegia coerulea]